MSGTPDAITRTRDLADRHVPNEDIAACLVIDCGLSWDQAWRFIEGNQDEIRARRGRFRALLREHFDQVRDGTVKAKDGYQMGALLKSAEVYLGWKPSDDKAKPKGQRPQLVKAAG